MADIVRQEVEDCLTALLDDSSAPSLALDYHLVHSPLAWVAAFNAAIVAAEERIVMVARRPGEAQIAEVLGELRAVRLPNCSEHVGMDEHPGNTGKHTRSTWG